LYAGADPLAAAAAASGSSAPSAAVPAGLPPHFVPSGQEHPLVAMAQNYERMCAEMLSRPPYNTDAILAQQVRQRQHLQICSCLAPATKAGALRNIYNFIHHHMVAKKIT